MKIISRRNALFAAVLSASVVAGVAWVGVRAHMSARAMPHVKPQVLAQKPPVADKSGHSGKPDISVAKVREQPKKHVPVASVPRKIIRTIRIEDLVAGDMKRDPLKPPKNVLAKVGSVKQDAGLDFDFGGKLPWPTPNSGLPTSDKDIGFHVGVNYHLDRNWDVTGLAGVKMVGGTETYQAKPVIDQIGIQARYRF